MKRKKLGFLIITGLLLVTGCNKIPQLPNGEELVAKIDGKDITTSEVYKELKKQMGVSAVINIIDDFIADKEIETDDDIKDNANFQLDQTKMEFENAGEDFNEALANYGFDGEKDYLNILILDQKKNKVVQKYYKDLITEEEINNYYENDVHGDMDVRHILIIPEEKDNEEDQKTADNVALKKAEDLIKKLNEGADFEKLAKENSDDEGSAENGGLIKNVTKDKYISEFFEASLKLEKGKYTKTPVKSLFGYHIVLKVEQKSKPTLDEAKNIIIDDLVNIKMQEQGENATLIAWTKIRKKYNLEIFDNDIKKVYNYKTSTLND